MSAYGGSQGTSCAVCHMGEIEVDDGRYASAPLRPPERLIVPLDVLRAEHETCDPVADAERCAMFSALLDHGEVTTSPFPETYLTLTRE